MGNIKQTAWNLKLKMQGNCLKYLDWLKKIERMDGGYALVMQQERMRRLLLDAFDHVPYYRTILDKADIVRGDKSVELANFSKLPFLTKDIIRENFSEMVSDNVNRRKCYENTSGGSTGEPVRFIQDNNFKEWQQAVSILSDFWSGYSPGQRKILLWGSERDLFVGHDTLKVRIGRWLKNEIWLNSFRMSPEDMAYYVRVINDFKPVQVLAYAESIFELAGFIERDEMIVYSPKAIMTSAGTLYSHMRETVERVFKSPVFNRYGSREAGNIACECEGHEGLHVFPATHYVEIIKDDGTPAAAGECGEIAVTSLTNYCMPLIRYKIGDMGTWAKDECGCGRKWPLLKEVAGRVSDSFVKKDGTRIHGEYFTHLFYPYKWIRKFQIIQEEFDSVGVVIIPAKKDAEDIRCSHSKEIDDVTEKIRLIMGKDCRVGFEFVKDIPALPSGKYRYTISKIKR